IATPTGISVGPVPPTATGATGRAGWGRGASAGFGAEVAAGDDGFAGAGFVPGFDDGAGTRGLPAWGRLTVPAHLTGRHPRGARSWRISWPATRTPQGADATRTRAPAI